jgi:ferrous iron transport protein B
MKNVDLKVVLSGNPNCGKSSLFNHLTGLNQRITNIPGTTIERKTGALKHKEHNVKIIDTPGTYSIDPKSTDEKVALEVFDKDHKLHPDLIVYVADASNFKRNLFFFSQLAELKIPMVLALNMVDIAEHKGMKTDIDRLEKELGIVVIPINARNGENVDLIRDTILKPNFEPHYSFSEGNADMEDTISERYNRIESLIKKTQTQSNPQELITDKIDRWVTHRVWGYFIFVAVLMVIFQSVFKLAEIPMDWIELGFEKLAVFLGSVMAEGWLKQLTVHGILAGLAGVIVFVPQIIILFIFMTLLEDTGYMARVSFIMDRLLKNVGLNGKSVVPLLSGAACAIPAIMATRNIENAKDRIITILVTPLMSCSARLPVYTLLIAMAIPDESFLGFFNLQGLVLLSMYLLGTVASLVSALIFKWFIKLKQQNYFILELPVYHTPRWKNIWITCWQKSTTFVVQAGKVIFIVSILLWYLATHGPDNNALSLEEPVKIEESYAAMFGKTIEPSIKPLGFDWKIGIALITSFAAREVFVGTMSTIYSVGDEEDFVNIRSKMKEEKDPLTGKPRYSIAVVMSLMIFYAFAMQCISTLAVVKKETGSWKWPLIQLFYMTGLAYLASFITYTILS